MTNLFSKFGFAFFALMTLGMLAPQAASAPREKLGIVNYAAPPGMKKTPQKNVVAFSEMNATTGAYCIITLYGATPGTGTPAGNFAREWKNLVANTMTAKTKPETQTQTGDGWTSVAGGTEVESGAGKAVGFLTVISGFGKTISILAVFNQPEYATKVAAFIDAIELDDVAPPATVAAAAPPTLDADGNLVILQPTRQLTVADLVGAWGDNPGRIATTYVDRTDGSYVGTDSLHFTSNWTIEADGKYTNDFFEVRNGKKFRDITTGTIAIAGRLITIKHKGTAKYVIRGWLELPNMTILKVAGPWYDAQPIPDRIFTDFSEDSRFILTTKWVRKK